MEAIALLDPEGRVLELNAATRQLLGGGEGAHGKRFWDLPWWPRVTSEADRAAARRNTEETLRRAAAGEEIRLRADLVDATGTAHVIDFSLRPVRSGDRTVAIVAEGRDITPLVSGGGES
jgi:PAS domain S-box-containing protein